jgi:nucleoside-diphosphate-sugar epimerase
MRKILITGGAGFVGRHFIKRFLEMGDFVYCVDNIVPGTGGINPKKGWPFYSPFDFSNFNYYQIDCRDFFKEHPEEEFDLCLHLAAIVGGRSMIEGNPLAVADDLSIDAAYWQWAITAKPAKTICFSSSAAYPIKYQQELNYVLLKEEMIDFEDDIGIPDMSYGWSKLTCEYLARIAFQKYGLKSVSYRPFSGYGEDQDDSYPFPSIIKRAIVSKGKEYLYVWGRGNQLRDFIHIDDCVAGVLKTMEQVDDGDAINLSTGIFTSFKQLAGLAAERCGYNPQIIGMSDKPSGVFARGGETKKQRKLGFMHTIELTSGIARAIKYFENAM